jgi:hypothetical protein
MQGVGVLRIQRQGLLAAHLGVQMPAGAEMLNAGPMERSWCIRRRLAHSYPGAFGSRLAFATVHHFPAGIIAFNSLRTWLMTRA